MQDLYSVLGLSRHASSEEIKAAYWALVKRSHPDINAGDERAERRTKEFNRAYETLSNPEERAAYDLELGRLRARVRRGFWRAAATGAMTFILAAGIFAAAVKWTQYAEIHRTAGGEPALSARDARNETLAARPHPDDHVALPVSGLVNPDRSNAPGKPVSTPPGPPSQSINSEPATASLRDGTAQALDERASLQEGGAAQPTPPTPARAEAPPEVGAKQPTPATSTREEPQPAAQAHASPQEVGAKPPTPSTPAEDDPRRTRHANASPPQVDAKQPVPVSIPRIQKKSKRHVNIVEVRKAPISSKPQRSDRERGLVSSSATAMRFPSADEPYVNLGARNR